MRCPFCAHENSQVKDSRPTEDGSAIRRRRQCEDCGARFTTFERIQLRELTVIKRDGRKVPFDREKFKRSIMIATRKRGIDDEERPPMRMGEGEFLRWADRLMERVPRHDWPDLTGEWWTGVREAVGELGASGQELNLLLGRLQRHL